MAPVRARPGRLRSLGTLHREYVLYEAFVWLSALYDPFRRFLARAVLLQQKLLEAKVEQQLGELREFLVQKKVSKSVSGHVRKYMAVLYRKKTGYNEKVRESLCGRDHRLASVRQSTLMTRRGYVHTAGLS